MGKKCLLAILTIVSISANAQINPCRPKICLVDYNYHDDSSPNADMTAIQTTLPDILVDNTPGGYWAGGCLPPKYTPLGIQVFSYITGGYEGTKYDSLVDNLTANLARVDAIAADSATGVFLDEVSSYPDTNGKIYITSIYNECRAKGLKLIFNPGVSTFDSWLMGYCDYLTSDEHYNGTRSPTVSESPYAGRLLVVAYNITSAANAAAISLGAQSHGFGYSYACTEYISLPSWLGNYMALITQSPPPTPIITLNGNILNSDATHGNQWYELSTGILTGDTNQSYTPTANGIYYDIVTISTCSSDSSNNIDVVLNGMMPAEKNKTIKIYPDPVSAQLTIETNDLTKENTLTILNLKGQELINQTLTNTRTQLDFSNMANGIYFVKLINDNTVEVRKIIKE